MNITQKIIAGLTILQKYDNNNDVDAQHDILYAGAKAAERMSAEDKEAMLEAGWHWCEEFDCYGIFV